MPHHPSVPARTPSWGLFHLTFLPALLMLPVWGCATASVCPERDSTQRVQDSAYVRHFGDKVVIKLDVEDDNDRFKVDGVDFKYDIRANLGPAKVLSLNYRWAYLGISYLPRVIDPAKHNARKGESAGLGFGCGLTRPKLLLDLSYKQQKGFYLHNTEDYVPGWDGTSDPYIQFPDMKFRIIRGTAAYKLNPNFSMRAIQAQTEAQRKSAASLIPTLQSAYFVTDNETAGATSSQRASTLEVLAQLSYYGTWVIHRWVYLSGGAGIGVGGYYTWLLTRQSGADDVYSELWGGMTRGLLHAGLGYNGDRFIAGAEILYQKSLSREPADAARLQYTRTAYQVFLGYRLNSPKWLTKAFGIVDF